MIRTPGLNSGRGSGGWSRGRVAWLAPALALALAVGCGPDPETLAKQDEEIRKEYERQKVEPKWLTPEQKQIRRERMEQEYGEFAPK